MNSNQPDQMPGFDLEGHRGCRGLMPENTIPAMLIALDLGVTTLEMDAVITKDSQVILSHDPYFNHEISSKPDGSSVSENEEKQLNIFKMLYKEVEQYDVGMKPHPRFPGQRKMNAVKPLLRDVIDSVEHYIKTNKLQPVFYNIETKSTPYTDGLYHPAPFQFVELLMKVVKDRGIGKRTIIQSFDIRTLQYLHKRYSSIKTSLLIEDFDKRGVDEQLRALGFNPSIYSPHYSLVTKELIKKCHEKSIKVIPWTVNDLSEMQQLKNMGVDGLISDFPDLYKNLNTF
ncbi:glycerophosphodiester phosphodiesterase [Chitinophagaceae bacterium LB-8]|uniref:Glycerophosphodiester phosphodiesterase n=1 Tax=Paraflavisolibacter caeni TaxID=2982496 RepID=A0A9X2XNS8_9BACT|nr:glycerophosphodiester phosphodiesterase [Paraflavisolibacter caeni]MCU7549014.1 glycerophosphodiester phosphodiesterase [Paraflavisolibacter caeni]